MAKLYIPLTEAEQQAKANRIAQKFCTQCIHDYPECKNCVWYLVMNAIVGEEEF